LQNFFNFVFVSKSILNRLSL